MKNKILPFIYPLLIIIPLAFLMLRPNSFNLIPYTIYHAFSVKTIGQQEFILWFDLGFLGIMYWFVLRVVYRIINWRKK